MRLSTAGYKRLKKLVQKRHDTLRKRLVRGKKIDWLLSPIHDFDGGRTA